jgi:AraC-like DNA-binding protein
MEVNIHKPLSPLLQRHIECFYTLTRQNGNAPSTYLTFPGIYNIVCLYANTVTEVSGNLVSIRHEPNGILESRVVGKFSKAVCVQYEGQISEITTLFKPLAINAFLPSPLKDLTCGHFSFFNPYPDFLPSMQVIQGMQVIPDKQAALEAYWLSKYHGYTHPFLPAILDEMSDEEIPGRSIAEMCKSHEVSRQTMHQHFERYLCKTPAEFRKVIRFRKAVNAHRLLPAEQRLTRLSLLANYFDQSHMIRDFKELTGHTPKSFFRSISRLGDGEINWLFL